MTDDGLLGSFVQICDRRGGSLRLCKDYWRQFSYVPIQLNWRYQTPVTQQSGNVLYSVKFDFCLILLAPIILERGNPPLGAC
jgi:hypothetical protein